MPTPTSIRTALTLGITTSGVFAGIGLAFSIGTLPLLLDAPAPTLLRQWRAMYDMGLWIGPTGAILAATSLGYAAYALRQSEQSQNIARRFSDDAKGTKEGRARTDRGGAKTARGGDEGGAWKAIALAAGTCVGIVPFTWAFLVPTSAVLLLESEGAGLMTEEVLRKMIVRWGWICAARAVLPLVGTAVGVWSVLRW